MGGEGHAQKHESGPPRTLASLEVCAEGRTRMWQYAMTQGCFGTTLTHTLPQWEPDAPGQEVKSTLLP